MKYLNLLSASSAVLFVALSINVAAQAKVWQLPERTVDLTSEIDNAERNGSITPQAANEFRSAEQQIVEREANYKKNHNNNLTPEEVQAIDKDVTELSKRIEKVKAAKVDNTAKNTGDNRPEATVPEDQSPKKNDVNLTANIRKELVDDTSLSDNAKNVKIISNQGIVTLRGVVDSKYEKDRVVSAAQRCAGSTNVVDELNTTK